MAGEWGTLPLGEVAAVRSGYAFKSSDWAESGVPVVKIANVKSGRLEMAGCSFVDEAVASGAGDFRLSVGDILIAMTGYVGDVARVRKADLPCVLNQRVGKFTVLSRERLNADYLFQFLAWADTRQTIAGLGYGSAQPNVSPALIHKVEIPLPPLSEQKRIAHILGTLDDKIELNRRMNTTLEAMSRAIFKSWFVDFDPVRQKAAGKQPVGMDAQTAALFPDSFEDSEIGEVPKGWAAIPFAQMLSPRNERAGDRALIEYSSTNAGVFPRSERFNKQLSVSASKNKVIKRGDLVFGLSREVLNFGLMRDEIGSVSGAYKVFSVDGRMLTPDLLERIMRSRPNYYYGAVSASSREGQAVSTDSLLGLLVVGPPADLQAAFYETANKLDAVMVSCDRQSRTLAALRDTLLPKLLSGEVRVREAEGMVEEAVR